MLRSYFRTAWRNLTKNKIYSFINITGLAIGLASALLISLWVKDEISYDQFHARGPQLYRVMANLHWGDVTTGAHVPALLNNAMKKDIPEVEYASIVRDDKILLSVGENHFKENGYYVTEDFLRMFSFPLWKGNADAALLSPSGIVITQRLAQKYFGKENAIGKLIRINDKDILQVTAVAKNIPHNSSLQFDWLIPLNYQTKNNPSINRWGSYTSNIYVALRPDANLVKVNGTLKHFLAKSRGEKIEDELFLQPYTEIYLHGNFKAAKPDGGRIEYVQLFSLIAIIVLFIACINFMNLTTARSIKRAKEIGIRKVIGANRKAIIWQFLGEAFFLTLIAGVFTLLIVQWALPYFNETTGKSIAMNFSDPGFIFLIVAIIVITAFVAGSYPALFLSSFQPIKALKSILIKSDSANIFRKGLVVFQFSLSIVLIVGAIIVYKQVEFIRNKNIGFDKETLLTMPVEGDTYTHMAAFQQELERSPGIKSATITGENPIDISGTSADLQWPGKPESQITSVSATWVGYNYIKTMEVDLVAGRDFSPARPDSNNYIINESAAKLMHFKDPIGKEMEFWNGKGQIIGVVKDFHLHSLHEPITPLVIVLMPQNASLLMV